MALSNKHIRFIDEYMIDLNATRAYVAAGYAKKLAHTHASKLLQNATIAEEIAKRQNILSAKTELTKEAKLDRLEQVIQRFLLDGVGTANALRAIELHNKMLGHNEPIKLEHSGSIDYNLTLPGIIDITPEDSETEED